MRFEYKIVPVPTKGKRAKGLKTPEARFAAALEEVMSALGAEGWVYVGREEHEIPARKGLFRKTTIRQAYLTFRREVAETQGEVKRAGEPVLAAPQVVKPQIEEKATLSAPVVAAPDLEKDNAFEQALNGEAQGESPKAAPSLEPAAARELADQIAVLSKRLEGITAGEAEPNAPVPFRQREQKTMAAAE